MGEATTIRVSKGTLEMLESLRKRTAARSLDQTIRMLISSQRRATIRGALGLDKDRMGPFTEEDRGEDRS